MVNWRRSRAAFALPVARVYEKAILESFYIQVIVIVLSGSMLDGGLAAEICGIALAAFWIGVIVLIWRRPANPTKVDLGFVRIGYLLVVLLAAVISPAIWRWRGVW